MNTNTITNESTDATVEPRSSRRNLLRLAGAAAVAGAGASLLANGSASAATGAMQYGTANNAGTDGTYLTASRPDSAFEVTNPHVNGAALFGSGAGDGTGVKGLVNAPTADAYGVWGQVNGSVGYGVVAQGGAAQVFLNPNNGTAGLPVSGVHKKGELVANGTGLYYCVDGDRSGVGTWRTVADSSAAGAFFPISPARVYDSRKAAPSPGILATGANRTISVADKRDTNTGAVTISNVVPAGATAISFNLTVVNTVGTNGFLAVNEGGNATVAASLINWSSVGLTTANSTVVKINSSRQITVICGGTSTSCHFIIDVLGYYR